MAKTQTPKQHWYDKTIVWLIYSLAAGIPLIFSTAFYSNFAAPKLLFLRVITIAILLLWAWKSFAEEKITYRMGKFGLALAAYGVVLIFSTLISSNIFTSLFGAESRFLGVFTQLNFLLIAWIVYNFLTTTKQLKNFVEIMCFTGVVVLMIYGFLQYFGAFNDNFSWSQNPQDRVFGTFGHSDHFGAFLGMCIALSFGFIPFIKNKISQLLLSFCVVGTFILLLLTGSRAALVSTLISLIVVVGILGMRNQNFKNFFHKFWKALVVLLVLVVGIVAVFQEPISKLPVIQRFAQGAQSVQDGYPPDRISWWYSSFEMFKARPLLGFGLATFPDIYNQYRRQDYKVPGPGNIQYQITPESSHDDYIDILVTEGLVGLIIYAALLFIVFATIDKKVFKKEKPDDEFYLTLGIKGALMVYLIQAIVNLGVVDTVTIFFLLMGAGMSAALPQAKNGTLQLKPKIKELIVCLFLVVLIWAGISTSREAFAEYNYRTALVEAKSGRPENARGWFEEIIKQEPYRFEYYEAYADFAFQNASGSDIDPEYTKQYLQLALDNYQKASVINNFHPSTFYNMGVTSVQLGLMEKNDSYTEQGINDLQQAIKLSPNNPFFEYNAAKIFSQIGQKDLAIQSFTDVVRLDPQFLDAQQKLDELQSTAK